MITPISYPPFLWLATPCWSYMTLEPRNIGNNFLILVFIFVFQICNLIIRWRIPRHGVCHMFQFYASKIPEKTRKLRHFWQTKNENVGCFTHLFWKKLSVFVQLSTQIQTHSSYFVKTLGLIRQNIQNFTWAINVFHKWHLWQIPGLRIPRKEVLAIQLLVPVKTYFFST